MVVSFVFPTIAFRDCQYQSTDCQKPPFCSLHYPEVLEQRIPIDDFCASKHENDNQQNNENRCLYGNLSSFKGLFSIH